MMYISIVYKTYKVLVMQVGENTCIRHEMSLRKISKSLALKALDSTNNRKKCKKHSSGDQMWHIHVHILFVLSEFPQHGFKIFTLLFKVFPDIMMCLFFVCVCGNTSEHAKCVQI